jgi:hypothetical protein
MIFGRYIEAGMAAAAVAPLAADRARHATAVVAPPEPVQPQQT